MKSNRKNREAISPEKLISKKDAAEILGVCCRTLERWNEREYIRFIRIGGRMFVKYSEIFRIRDQLIDVNVKGNYLTPYFKSVDYLRRLQTAGKLRKKEPMQRK